jgi:hypothetical protein
VVRSSDRPGAYDAAPARSRRYAAKPASRSRDAEGQC